MDAALALVSVVRSLKILAHVSFVISGLGVGCGFGVGWGFGGESSNFDLILPDLILLGEGGNLGCLGLGVGGGCGIGIGVGWGFGVGWGSKYINQHFVFRETARTKNLGLEAHLAEPVAHKKA